MSFSTFSYEFDTCDPEYDDRTFYQYAKQRRLYNLQDDQVFEQELNREYFFGDSSTRYKTY